MILSPLRVVFVVLVCLFVSAFLCLLGFVTFALDAKFHELSYNSEEDITYGFQGDVDLVVTYVDTGDPEWYARFEEAKGGVTTSKTSRIHYEPCEDILYCVSLARQNMPWLRNIWILTQRPQYPKKLMEANIPGVRLVHHDECGLKEPTYNGMRVSTLVHHIPGLSEHFIRSDDDVFVTRPLPVHYFFDRDGRPVMRPDSSSIPPPLTWWWSFADNSYETIKYATYHALRRHMHKRGQLFRLLANDHRMWPTQKNMEMDAEKHAAKEIQQLGLTRGHNDINFGTLYSTNWMARKFRQNVILLDKPDTMLRKGEDPRQRFGRNIPPMVNINDSITENQRNWLDSLCRIKIRQRSQKSI